MATDGRGRQPRPFVEALNVHLVALPRLIELAEVAAELLVPRYPRLSIALKRERNLTDVDTVSR